MHFLILGGGSAGCVLAARLSENAAFKITLVEAGRNLTRENMEPIVRSRNVGRAYLDPANIWPDLEATCGAPTRAVKRDKQKRRYEQARVLGGGSVINAMTSNRGAPQDYNEWGEMGAKGWSFESVLPYFRKLETDRDYHGDFHGDSGPLTIRRISEEKMSPFVKALRDEIKLRGIPEHPDQNGEWGDGLYRCAVSLTDNDERNPVSAAYLTPEVRKRSNLRIVTGKIAETLLTKDGKITGARVADYSGGVSEDFFADQVILSCGAIHTPALLMRSGIGPEKVIRDAGIQPILNLSGIGQNLREHPSTAVAAYLPSDMRAHSDEHHDQMVWRMSSGMPNVPVGDVHVGLFARTAWHPIGRRLGAMFFWINKSFSQGSTKIRSADPRQEPAVDLNLLSDERDLKRARDTFLTCAEILQSSGMRKLAPNAFPASYSKRVAQIAGAGVFSAFARAAVPPLLDFSGPLRSQLIKNFVTDGLSLPQLLSDETKLNDYLLATIGGTWHASGTCRMGLATDPMAVTDECGRIRAISGLRVCDASLMPTIPCANTNIPTIMMAERIADMIKNEFQR